MTSDLTSAPPLPFSAAYWVFPGRFLAGPYPGSRREETSHARVQSLLDLGVTLFVDLTEAAEAPPYTEWLLGRARHRRMPVPDFDIPSAEQLQATLELIEGALAEGQTVYLHCLGGRGRTGTVVGCYLVRQGLHGAAALEEIARLRRGIPEAGPSPETEAQRSLVRAWGCGSARLIFSL